MSASAGRERRVSMLAMLGLPTMGLSLGITTVSALVPVVIRRFTTSSTVAGAIVGGEGALALALPLVLGTLSDRTHTRLGGRLPYVIASVPLCVLGLLAIPAAGSLFAIAASVLLFYIGYYVYYPPYQALFPDIVARDQLGRSQGVQTVFREIGLGGALFGGPLFLGLSLALPFWVAAAVLTASTIAFVFGMRRQVDEARERQEADGGRAPGHSLLALLRQDHGLWRLLLANSLWELALAGIKTFIVLYLVAGLDRSRLTASAMMGIFALIAIVAAPIAGHLADRYGPVRVSRIAFLVFGAGMIAPVFTRSPFVLVPLFPFIGFGAVVAMTLPYALLATRLPNDSQGAGAGLYEFSRGIGILLGPVLAGTAVDVARPWLRATHGYSAMWIVCSAAILLSVPIIPRAPAR